MLQQSDKENRHMERPDTRQVAFHFCEKYAKKGERRIKTEANEQQPRMVRGSKITLVAKGRPLLESRANHHTRNRKLSNFEILKRKISYLETEQFLGDKTQRCGQGECNPEVDYLVTGEFVHSKRIALLEKYRQSIKNIRKDHEQRKNTIQLLLQPHSNPPPPQNPPETDPEWLLKKREVVSQCAKRYFRPQSLNRSRQGLGESIAQIKGKKVEGSLRAQCGMRSGTIRAGCTGRAHRSTINFY